MDDNQALNEATEAPVEAPTTEIEAPTTEAEGKTEVATEVKPEAEVEEGSRKTANARIRELDAEKKAAETRAQQAEEKAKSLVDQMAELTGSVDPGAQAPYTPQVEPGSELTPEQYQADVARAADSIVQLRMKQKEVLDKVNNESRDAIKSHPKLDPSSGEFDRELSESISSATLALISRNPTASVKKFVDSLMKPYERSVAREVGEASEKMAKQVSETALRPTSVQEQGKSVAEKTLKEMEDDLGIVY